MSVRVDQQPAYVLHRRAYRETSLLLDLLTRDHGRVAVVARAARSGTRAWGAFCQPFQSLLVSWTGRSELKSLTAAERAGDATAILGERLYSALYVNELLVRLLHFPSPPPLRGRGQRPAPLRGPRVRGGRLLEQISVPLKT